MKTQSLRIRSLPRALLVFAGMVAACASLQAASEKPNVVVILADDLGYGSVGCYGGTGLRTPNIDRLAREGRKFTNGYATGSVCSPTRYGLITGRYYWRTSVKDGKVLPANSPLHIEPSRATIASIARGAGYRTAAFGKWHLGLGPGPNKTDWNAPLKPGPNEIGFDYFLGVAANPWSGPHQFLENHDVQERIPGQQIEISGKQDNAVVTGLKSTIEPGQLMQALTARTVSWIEQNKEKPFLVYFAPNAVHMPIVPSANFKGRSSYGIYGDFIEELDWSVGQILDKLDQAGLAENTLVIFSGDNGGVVNPGNKESSEAKQKGLAINGPLREGKHSVYEGGFREPFLVRWPLKVPAGSTSAQVVSLVDLPATIASIVGQPLPAGQAEDSFDVSRALFEAAEESPVRDHVILQSAYATYAIRSGNWKFVEGSTKPEVQGRNRKQRSGKQADELYDLAADPGETRNVSAENPEIVERLRARLISARNANGTRPGLEVKAFATAAAPYEHTNDPQE